MERRPKRIVHLGRLASPGGIGRTVNGQFTTMLKTSPLPAIDKLATDKLLGLEGLGFAATVSVLLCPYQHFAYRPGRPVGLVKQQLPFYSVLFPFFEAGEYGVWIFWCISGFIFFWKYRSIVADRTIGGWAFFVYRLLRAL